MLHGNPVVACNGILDNGSMLVVEVKEQKDSKVGKSSQTSGVGSMNLEGKRELAPSISSRRSSFYEMTSMDS